MSSIQNPSETQEDAIIRVIGYQRQNYHQKIIRFEPGLLLDWQTSMTRVIQPLLPAGLVAGLGTMNKLPNEIFLGIFKNLDIQSVLDFRNVSHASREIVHSTFEYRAMTEHVPTALLAILRAKLATWLTFDDLYRAFLTRDCENCGKLAGFLYLPRQRVTKACEECLENVNFPQFRTVTLASYAKGAAMGTKTLRKQVPVLWTLPGDYFGLGITRSRRQYMVNYCEAQCIVNKNTETVYCGTGHSGDYRGHAPRDSPAVRRMATVPFPFFDFNTESVGHILACGGCAVDWHRLHPRIPTGTSAVLLDPVAWKVVEMNYSRATLLAHFQACPTARELWEASKQGTVSIADLETPFIKKGELSFGN